MPEAHEPHAHPTEPGLCPGCEEAGPVARPCARPVCTRRGLCFIPREFIHPGAPDPLVGRVVDAYLIVRLLGAGGFGKVYLALQLPILMRSAVKILHHGGADAEEQRKTASKFLSEAKALATLTHPNIVRLLQFGAFDDTAFLAMEFVDGGMTLRDLVTRRAAARQPLTVDEIGVILRQLLDALEAAHARSIVHRDVKPENIMVQSVPGHPLFVRVLDFGLAKLVSEQTETSAAMGTPVYMAPEQLTRRHIGPWTDIYAVGALAFELVLGRRPFAGDSAHEIFAQKLDATMDPMAAVADADLPEEAAAFFRKAMAFDYTQRYADVPSCRAGLEAALRALAARSPAVASPAVTVAPGRPEMTADVDAPEPIDSSHTRMELGVEVTPLRPTPPRPLYSTDTVERARPRRRWPLFAGVGVAAAAAAAGVMALAGRGPMPELARRVPADMAAYVRVADVAHLRERLVATPILARPDALRRELDPWFAKVVGEAAHALGVPPEALWTLLDHALTVEMAAPAYGDPLVRVRLDDPAVGERALTAFEARRVGEDRWNVDRVDMYIARDGDALVIGRRPTVEAALAPSGAMLADVAAFADAWRSVGGDVDLFEYIKPPPFPPSLGIPELGSIAIGAVASGETTVEVALPPGQTLPDFLVREPRAKALLPSLPPGTLLAWAVSCDGAKATRESFGRWVDALPAGPQAAVRESFGLGADTSVSAGMQALETDVVRMAQDLATAVLPVKSELDVAFVRDAEGRLAPLVVFDIEDEAQAKTLATKLFDEGSRKDLPWQSLTLDGMFIRFLDVGELLKKEAAKGGAAAPPLALTELGAAFDLRVGYGLHDGLFVVGGIDAIRDFLAARAGRLPRFGDAIAWRGVDKENALQLTAQLGDFAHGPRSPLAPLADVQAELAKAIKADTSLSLTARVEPGRVRLRTNAPLATLALWLSLVRKSAPTPTPPDITGEGTMGVAGAAAPVAVAPGGSPLGMALTDEQLTYPLELDGGAHTTLADMAREQVVLLTFAASSCTPCMEQMPERHRLETRLGEQWRVVDVMADDAWSTINMALLRQTESFSLNRFVRDPKQEPERTLRATFGTTLMPESMVIYRGRLIDRFDNGQPWSSPSIVGRLMRDADQAGIVSGGPSEADRAQAERWKTGGTLVFEDTFTAPTPSTAWSWPSAWSVVDGEARAAESVDALWLVAPIVPEPGRVELTVSGQGSISCWLGGSFSDLSVDGRVVQNDNRSDTLDGPLSALDTFSAGPNPLALRPTRFQPGQRYRWALVRDAGNLYWFVDGELWLARHDTSGMPGRSFGCAALAGTTVDDVRVYQLTP